MSTGLIRIFLFLGIWGLGIGQSWGRIVYVDSSRTAGSQNGTSWTNAYSNLQTALTAAVAGDSLWVAKGTYYPGASGANSSSFNTKNNVRLFGGFTGFSGIQETSINQRNWTTNLTILSGDLDKSGGFSSLDAFHVVASTGGVDTSATLNGFRITGGNANVVSGANERGGGVFFFGAGIRLENCDIRGNRAASFGGGVYGNGHIVMRNCFVRNNTCSSQGGGFYLAGNTNVHRYYNCVFANNTSTSFGGAFFTGVTNMRFYNCTFTGNVGSTGNVMLNAQSSVILQNCIVWGNGNPSSAFVSGNPTITRSIVEGGYASGTGIINANPNFLDSDYRIKACSPAVDAGDALTFVPTDLSGAPRPFDADLDGLGEWDLGAFEVQVPAVAPANNPILGSNPACSNQQNALYQPTTNNSSTNQYVWTLSGGGTIDGSNTNSTVRIDWGTTLGTYTITMLEYGSVTGCSTTNSVTVTLAASPVASLSPSGNGAICSGDSILLSGSGVGISRQWYYNGAPIPGATNTSYFAKMSGVYNYQLTSSNGCSDTATVSYRLSLNPLPTFTIGSTLGSSICQNQITTLSAPSNGTAWQWFRNGNPIGGATSSTYNTGLAGSYDVRYTNSNGCRNLATSPLVIIVNPLPVVSVTPTGHDTICPSTNLQLSATSTGATAYQWYLNGQSIGSATNSTFPAALTGWYNAIITDGNGCRDSAAAGKRLTVADFEAPTAVCQNLTRYLDANGSASITATQVNNGSTDDCAVVGLSLNKTIFGCTDLGTSPTTLTVTDIGGNTRSCNANITVLDTIRPNAVCSNKTVYLSAAGSVTLTFSTIDLNSSDNCGISSSQISPPTFNCSQIGSHPVVGTIQDASGNVRTCNAVVTVADSTKPNAICATPVLTLDVFGFASLTPAQADNGSNDNCGIGSLSLTRTTFGCSDVPGVSQTLQITDVNGNSSTCQVFVRIQDLVAPIALCQDTMIFIDMTGQSILTPLSIDNGSNDNCGITGRTLSQNVFTCQDTGLNVVTMTVLDADTNLSTCTSQVRVFDTIAPVAVCTDLTIYLDSLGNAVVNPLQMGANSTDNCGFFATAFVDVGSYTCSGIGPHPTLLVMGDVSGVRDSCTGLVTVADSTGPFMACRNLSLNLVGGVGTITTS